MDRYKTYFCLAMSILMLLSGANVVFAEKTGQPERVLFERTIQIVPHSEREINTPSYDAATIIQGEEIEKKDSIEIVPNDTSHIIPGGEIEKEDSIETVPNDDINDAPDGELPDLQPYQRSTWDNKIVLSTVTGTGTSAGTIYDDQTIYVDYGCMNSGSGAAGHFRYGLYIDGSRVKYADETSMAAGYASYVTDSTNGPLSAGSHTFKVVCDYNHEVSETDENNNEYSRSITIATHSPQIPNIRIAPTSLTINQAGASSEQFEGTKSVEQPTLPQFDPAIQTLLGQTIVSNSVWKDFVDGEPTTRVIVNLHKPLKANQLRNFKDIGVRQQLQQTVKEVQNRIIPILYTKEIRITNQFTYIFSFSAEVSLQGLQDLADNADVLSIEKDEILHAHLAQGIPLMNASTARSSYNGSGLAIAICDTGIDYTHPRLGNGNFPNSKVIGGYDTGQDDADPMDANGHGTACAGVAAGDLGTVGDYIGGVAYNAKLYALKITSDASGGTSYTSDMVEAWEWCITHQNDDPNNPIMIISTSFGGGRYTSSCDSASPARTTAAANAVSAGMTLFVSSGNDGYCDSIGAPACISHVISVGAVYDANIGRNPPSGSVGCISNDSCVGNAGPPCDEKWYVDDPANADQVTTYSNSASFLSLLAPSNWAYTTKLGGAYFDTANGFGGTSAACPYAAGAAACLQSAAEVITGSYLSPSQVKSKMIDNGDPITDGKVAITKPRVNLGASVDSLSGSGSGSFTIYNDGTANLEITAMSKRDGDAWLSWTPTSPLTITPGGSRTVTVNVDWSQVFGTSEDEQIIVNSNDSAKSPYPNAVLITVTKANSGDSVFVNNDGSCNGNAPCYSTINNAYQSLALALAADGTIKVSDDFYPENIVLRQSLNIHLSGGWNSDYTDNIAGQSTIGGSLTITNGTIIIEGIVIDGTTSLAEIEAPQFGCWLPGYWSKWASLN